MEPVSYVIYNSTDKTYFQEDGDWGPDRMPAARYLSKRSAEEGMKEHHLCSTSSIRLEVIAEGTQLSDSLHLAAVLFEVAREVDELSRAREVARIDTPDLTALDCRSPEVWISYIVGNLPGPSECYGGPGETPLLSFRDRLVNVAALAVAAAQAWDRNLEKSATLKKSTGGTHDKV